MPDQSPCLTDLEIASQPSCWQDAARLAAARQAQLPRPGERTAVVGCGTSWFMAQSYAALREAAGHGETDAFAASEFPHGRSYDRVLAITRSGTTTEVLTLLGRLRGGPALSALTADPASPVCEAAEDAVVLDFADERSVVQTRFATSALALLRAHLGEALEPAVRDAEQALAQPLDAALTKAEQFTFLGTGWTVGLALEAGLKMREAAGMWTEAYPAMEYRHGPVSITGPGRVAWVFGTLPPGLARDIEAVGGTLVAGAQQADVGEAAPDPMADLIRVQRLAVSIAQARGMNPDRPRNLTRSVVLA